MYKPLKKKKNIRENECFVNGICAHYYLNLKKSNALSTNIGFFNF